MVQFVKQAVHLAMENHMHRGAFIEMLATLSTNGDISEGQMVKGFERCAISISIDPGSVDASAFWC